MASRSANFGPQAIAVATPTHHPPLSPRHQVGAQHPLALLLTIKLKRQPLDGLHQLPRKGFQNIGIPLHQGLKLLPVDPPEGAFGQGADGLLRGLVEQQGLQVEHRAGQKADATHGGFRFKLALPDNVQPLGRLPRFDHNVPSRHGDYLQAAG